jgi:hypothetical protein
MESNKSNEFKTSDIVCIYGNNKYRNCLIYNLVYEYMKTEKIKFGVVIGNAYPYYKYFSDNIYIKYDEIIMETYLKNLNRIYTKCNGDIDDNLLIVDSNLIDLTSECWKELLENYQIYKTNIIIILDKIMDYNINKLGEYVDTIFILKHVFNRYEYLERIYTTFFINTYHKEQFIETYIRCTDKLPDVMIANLKTNNVYRYQINLTLPTIVFNTYKIYESKTIYKQICSISDIIKV